MKKCIICGEHAELEIKGTSDFYCKPCASDNFADESYLQKIEQKVVTSKSTETENQTGNP